MLLLDFLGVVAVWWVIHTVANDQTSPSQSHPLRSAPNLQAHCSLETSTIVPSFHMPSALLNLLIQGPGSRTFYFEKLFRGAVEALKTLPSAHLNNHFCIPTISTTLCVWFLHFTLPSGSWSGLQKNNVFKSLQDVKFLTHWWMISRLSPWFLSLSHPWQA